MAKSGPKLRVKKPTSPLKSVKANFKDLFKGLAKLVTHTVTSKWEELPSDAVESLAALNLVTEPGELAFQLIQRSLSNALHTLVGESVNQLTVIDDADQVKEQLDYDITYRNIHFDPKFLDRPTDLPMLRDTQALLEQWLSVQTDSAISAKLIAQRLPSYFVYALNQEWRSKTRSYKPLLEAMDTPFSKAGDREWAWAAYSALLDKRTQEGVFDEAFGLAQMYVPLNAYYVKEKDGKDLLGRSNDKPRQRIVVVLQQELESWLQKPKSEDAIRVICGGPGSGKSSFARIFAANLSKNQGLKVLYVPLHLIDATKDLVDEVGRFVRDEGMLLQNPLDPASPESNLLIIFDGLDELASQGKVAAETARSFVREVEKTAAKRNLQSVKLRILLCGRELVVQQNKLEFRREGQILTLLPYFVSGSSKDQPLQLHDGEQYHDPKKILKEDLRNRWWKNYAKLTGRSYQGLPKDLDRQDLEEVTAQPLLNYLVALSYTRGELDFTKGVNLNSIYQDLVKAVHERGYEKSRAFVPIRSMNFSDFFRVLEEIGSAAWHGDGRTTTVNEIEKHCVTSGLGGLLETFKEGAEAGVTRLLAAFFFRQYGQRQSGDPTFIFTHKSFGEFLTARRIVRAVASIGSELERHADCPDGGWDEKSALKHWVQVCGPSAMSKYLHTFLLNEIELRDDETQVKWQNHLAKLFGYMLSHGMPMEQLQLPSFKEAMFQSRNAEESLLAALNACARSTQQLSQIKWPTMTAFGEWFKRIQSQRTGGESALAADCLSYLDLSSSILYHGDFYGSNLSSSRLRHGTLAIFIHANLESADLQGADLLGAHLESANLLGANLLGANLLGANLRGTKLEGANREDAQFYEDQLLLAITDSTTKGVPAVRKISK